jgi:hypothetical protein
VEAATDYRVEVIADESGQWAGNSLHFGSVEAAEAWARDLWSRWTLVREWRVVDDHGVVLAHS